MKPTPGKFAASLRQLHSLSGLFDMLLMCLEVMFSFQSES